MFQISKILGFVAQPSTLIWLLLLAGLWRAYRSSSAHARGAVATGRRRPPGVRSIGVAALVLLVAGITPLSSWLLSPLEERFPRIDVSDGSRDYAGIIVLGGGEDGRASVDRRQLHLNEAGERITEGAVLAKRLPEARLIFTGGVAALVKDVPGGAAAVGTFWEAMGIPAARIVIEHRSRNTIENAVFTRDLLEPKPGERFLLVTSAAHMPRSMGIFRKAGFDVVAYPTDYRTAFPEDALSPFGSIPAGLKRLDEGTKEWFGLLAYWLMGRTTALFPAP